MTKIIIDSAAYRTKKSIQLIPHFGILIEYNYKLFSCVITVEFNWLCWASFYSVSFPIIIKHEKFNLD